MTQPIRSPFPGMDPYLERHWGDVHTCLMVYARNQLGPQLPASLTVRVEEGLTVIGASRAPRTIYPDVSVVEEPSSDYLTGSGAVQVAEPLVLPVGDDFEKTRHIEIVDSRDGNRLVTVIEFLSPGNKVSQAGRVAYRRKQAEYVDSDVNLVEIDLVRAGSWILALPQEQVPAEWRSTYQICIRRATSPLDAELYRVPLQERLPNIRIPLRADDPDVVMQLQPLIDDCYRDGAYWKIDYSAELIPPLAASDAEWARQVLSGSAPSTPVPAFPDRTQQP
jgi:Protein of unknown function (DUF4058)